jgi:large subunit ribosomal protein L28
MPRICDFTGKGTKSGNNRSHSMRSSKRTFKPNLIYKMVTMEDGSRIRLKICAKIYKKLKGFL